MPELRYQNRRAVQIENDELRVTVTVEGGHLAEILHKQSGVNPLWTPPWPSIEPSTYDRAKHPEYGSDSESKLLAGIMGHNLCLGVFGPPSPEEAAAGLTVHGEGSIEPYDIRTSGNELAARTKLPMAQLAFERRIRLEPHGLVRISETVENLAGLDSPIAWTQHVTLGPPYLEKGRTQFRAPGTRSRTIEEHDFDWPGDLNVFPNAPSSGRFTTTLMDPHRDRAYFLAFTPSTGVLFGYVWKRADFPWLGIWEENHSRNNPPWNGRTLTRGMEFGASPMPEPRRKMIERNTLFGVPAYRWLPARGKATVEYVAFIRQADRIPNEPDSDLL
jgi:hypothetical protein